MHIEFGALLTAQHPHPILDRNRDSQNRHTPTLHLGSQAQEAQ